MQSIQKRYHALVVGKKIEQREGHVFQNLENPIEFSVSSQDLSSQFDMHSSYKVL